MAQIILQLLSHSVSLREMGFSILSASGDVVIAQVGHYRNWPPS